MTDEIVELLRPALCDEAGTWIVDYVRLEGGGEKESVGVSSG